MTSMAFLCICCCTRHLWIWNVGSSIRRTGGLRWEGAAWCAIQPLPNGCICTSRLATTPGVLPGDAAREAIAGRGCCCASLYFVAHSTAQVVLINVALPSGPRAAHAGCNKWLENVDWSAAHIVAHVHFRKGILMGSGVWGSLIFCDGVMLWITMNSVGVFFLRIRQTLLHQNDFFPMRKTPASYHTSPLPHIVMNSTQRLRRFFQTIAKLHRL